MHGKSPVHGGHMKRIGFLVLTAAAIACGSVWAQQADQLLLIPVPQKIQRADSSFSFSRNTSLFTKTEHQGMDFLRAQIRGEIKDRTGIQIRTAGKRKRGCIEMVLLGAGTTRPARAEWMRQKQAYVLNITPGHITIGSQSMQGLFYGVQTLRQLVRSSAVPGVLPCVHIIDWPGMARRGWQDDISRGPIPSMEFLKKQVRDLSFYKLNTFTLYTEHVFKLDSHRDIAPSCGITADEVRELTEYAARYHVEIIGNFQSFGHAKHILKVPGYEDMAETSHVLSPASTRTYEFLADAYKEIAPAYTSPLFNINCDEVFGLGTGQAKNMVDTMGTAGTYAYHIGRIAQLLEPYGKRIAMWGDILIKHPETIGSMPENTLFLPWAYHVPSSYDFLIRPFSKNGLPFMVCPGVSCWSRIWPDMQTAAANISLFTREGYKQGAIGMLNTTWDDDGENLFNYNWYPLVWGAFCSWRPEMSDITSTGSVSASRVLPVFNTAFDRLFFGEDCGGVSEIFLRMSSIRNSAAAGSLRDDWFWKSLNTSLNHRVSQSSIRDLYSEADAAEHELMSIEENRERGDDAVQAALFSVRRIKLLALNLCIAAMGGKSRGALSAADSVRYMHTIDEACGLAQLLRNEYEAAWLRENRQWYLKENLNKYDTLLADLKKNRHPVRTVPDTRTFSHRRTVTLLSLFPSDTVSYYILPENTGKKEGPFFYTGPFCVDRTVQVSASAQSGGKTYGPFEKRIYVYSGPVRRIRLKPRYSGKYPAGGAVSMVDGIRGSDSYKDGRWMGFCGTDMEAVIDLGQVRPVKMLSAGFMQKTGAWVMLPLWVEFSVSADGRQWRTLRRIFPKTGEKQDFAIEDFFIDVQNAEAQYIKVHAENRKALPVWHAGAGNGAWMFIDEIVFQ